MGIGTGKGDPVLAIEIFIGLFVVGLIVIIYRLAKWRDEDDDEEL